jgi:hypothetical protein
MERGKVLLRSDDGKAIAMTCKQCGEFTLDTVNVLCVSCSLKVFLSGVFGISNERR